MPILMRYGGNGRSASGASGGVWKTTNFLTTGPGTVRLSRISLANGQNGVDGRDPMPTRNVQRLFETARRGAPGGKLYWATAVGVFLKPIDGQGRLIMGTDQGVFSKGGVGALENVGGNNTWAGVAGHNTGALRNMANHNTAAGASRPGVGVLKSIDGGRTWPAPQKPMTWDNVKNKAASRGELHFELVEIFVCDGPGSVWNRFDLQDVTISPGHRAGEMSLSFARVLD